MFKFEQLSERNGATRSGSFKRAVTQSSYSIPNVLSRADDVEFTFQERMKLMSVCNVHHEESNCLGIYMTHTLRPPHSKYADMKKCFFNIESKLVWVFFS